MMHMATWEDGPEYAPLTRPRDFAPAPDSELETAPAQPRPEWSAPAQRPRDYQQQDLPPLSTLIPNPRPQRDASQPFDVVASNMTGMGALGGPAGPPGAAVATPVAEHRSVATAWNAAHWSPPAESSWTPPQPLNHSDPQRPFETSRQHQPQAPQSWPGLASVQPQPPPSARPGGNTWADPRQGGANTFAPAQNPHPLNQYNPNAPAETRYDRNQYNPNQPATDRYNPNQPATDRYSPNPYNPDHYAPHSGAAVPDPKTPGEFVRAVVFGIGLAPLICLALGLFPALAPLTLIAAFFLRRTGTIAQALISKFYFAAIGVVVVGSLASILNGNTFYTAVSQAAFFASLLLLIASFMAVSLALRSGRPQPPPPSQWG